MILFDRRPMSSSTVYGYLHVVARLASTASMVASSVSSQSQPEESERIVVGSWVAARFLQVVGMCHWIGKRDVLKLSLKMLLLDSTTFVLKASLTATVVMLRSTGSLLH